MEFEGNVRVSTHMNNRPSQGEQLIKNSEIGPFDHDSSRKGLERENNITIKSITVSSSKQIIKIKNTKRPKGKTKPAQNDEDSDKSGDGSKAYSMNDKSPKFQKDGKIEFLNEELQSKPLEPTQAIEFQTVPVTARNVEIMTKTKERSLYNTNLNFYPSQGKLEPN